MYFLRKLSQQAFLVILFLLQLMLMSCLAIYGLEVGLSNYAAAIWTVVGVTGRALMGIGYGFVWPVMETFKAISKEGDSVGVKLVTIFMDGTWNNLWGACAIVRDFAESSFHSYFSVMDELLLSKSSFGSLSQLSHAAGPWSLSMRTIVSVSLAWPLKHL